MQNFIPITNKLIAKNPKKLKIKKMNFCSSFWIFFSISIAWVRGSGAAEVLTETALVRVCALSWIIYGPVE